jgi:23S rRNA pseudouridine1911/1915/1917 synthase
MHKGCRVGDELDILFEDNHLIAVAKPAGVRSTHFDGTNETIDRAVKAYLKTKYEKPGNVFLGIVHRLDLPTSGVLLFARTSKAAARLSEQFRESVVEKIYWAVIDGVIDPPAGTMADWLWKDPIQARVQALRQKAPDAKHAKTDYETKARAAGFSWLELRPRTGRTHQLRVQLSSRGRPIVGDRMYDSKIDFAPGIALHARSLRFEHPISHEAMTLTAAVPSNFRQFGFAFNEPEA